MSVKINSYFCILLFIQSIFTNMQAHSDPAFLSAYEIQQLAQEAQQADVIEEQSSLDDQTDPNSTTHKNIKTAWTFIIYMAADNDLHYFALKNLKQLEQIGSNSNINIVVQINAPGYQNPTKRYIIKKGSRLLIQDNQSPTSKLNSGISQTLVDFANWSITNYPAQNYALILWNHGTGAMDPNFARTVNPSALFYLNPTEKKLEIDRGTSYITLICQQALDNLHKEGKRGICFDETFKTYLTNHDLKKALSEICSKSLGNKKLDLIGFDACLMSMIEITHVCKDYANYFVASQEIEYGTGWRYDYVLEPFIQKVISGKNFAQHIVHSYTRAYSNIINDYTLSAIDLNLTDQLENNIDAVATMLHEALMNQANRSVADIIRKCKSTQYCTCFDEPSFIDIGHFYENLIQHIPHIILKDKQKELRLKASLDRHLQQGLLTLGQCVIENQVGQKLKKARGISIYFPEHGLSQAYLKSPFALDNAWRKLLHSYILE